MVAPRFRSGRKKKRLRASESVVRAGDAPLWTPNPGGENCSVVAAPIVLVAPVLKRFRPSVVLILRSTLANLTF